ncbi:hypothetical protein [Nitrosococcus oceani]|uniref:hypothetical protein n=1 Tax=Nitrosococcus oceani TaxID=1229 RepID=UPI001E367489|nr:hypothetical protein [Nitrosococcus oceani]
MIEKSWKLAGLMSQGNSRWLGALRYGVAAGVEHVRPLKSLGAMGTEVDIGANAGANGEIPAGIGGRFPGRAASGGHRAGAGGGNHPYFRGR